MAPPNESSGKTSADPLLTPVEFLKGVGPHRAELLDRLGLTTARDVLFFFPRDYRDLTERREIAQLEEGKLQSVCGVVEDVDLRGTGTGRSVLGVLLRCGNGYLRGIWFNQPFLRERFAVGQQVMLSGKPKRNGLFWEMAHPMIVRLAEDEASPANGLLPVYPLTEGLQQWQLRRIVRETIASRAGLVGEVFPAAYLEAHRLRPIREAISEIHFPPDRQTLEQARRRFVYQELFVLQLALAMKRREQKSGKAAPLEATAKIDARIRRLFPFPLTAGQEQAIAEIAADMARPVPMNRLLQGDVGSGKTIVLLARRGAKVKAFSIGVPGVGHLDERGLARRVAGQFGLEHHVTDLAPPDEAGLRELARAFDEPFADASAYATLGLARLARQHVKVVLSGTGGDETLSGYERYALPSLLRRARLLPPAVSRAVLGVLARLRPSRNTPGGELLVRTAKLLEALAARPESAYAGVVSAAPRLWSPLLRGTREEAEVLLDHLLTAVDLRARPFDLAFGPAFDHRVYLPDDLLMKEDRATMAVSLESRVPFLDVEWLRWTERVGEVAKRPGGRPKGLLRRALAGRLPREITARPKHGFAQPVSEWLRRPGMGWLEGLFARSGEAAGLDARAARLLLAAHRSGGADAGEELWGAAMLALWHEEHAARAAAMPRPVSSAGLSSPPRAVRRASRPAPERTKVVRIISRMNVGGPAIHVSLLTAGLRDYGFDTLLVRGREGAFEGRMDDVARSYGVQPLSLPGLRREMHPMDDVRAFRGLVELLRRERPAIVHTHTSKAGMLGRLAALRVGVPVILHTFHGHVLDGYFHPLVVRGIVAVERELARRSTRLIAVSRATLGDMTRIGVPPEKLLHIPLGLPIDPLFELEHGRGNFRRSIGVPVGAPLVGIVARMAEVKRHEIFLEAALKLRETDPSMHFAIVGGGERESELRRLAQAKGLSEFVHFAGFRRDLDEILSDLDISVLCSRSEGLPVSLIEAMAAAVPIVATDVGGVRELLGDSEAGVLVPPEDPGRLAEAILGVLRDPEGASRLVREGRRRAEIYRERHLLEAMARLYRGLLGAPRPHHSFVNDRLDTPPAESLSSVGSVPGSAGRP